MGRWKGMETRWWRNDRGGKVEELLKYLTCFLQVSSIYQHTVVGTLLQDGFTFLGAFSSLYLIGKVKRDRKLERTEGRTYSKGPQVGATVHGAQDPDPHLCIHYHLCFCISHLYFIYCFIYLNIVIWLFVLLLLGWTGGTVTVTTGSFYIREGYFLNHSEKTQKMWTCLLKYFTAGSWDCRSSSC